MSNACLLWHQYIKVLCHLVICLLDRWNMASSPQHTDTHSNTHTHTRLHPVTTKYRHKTTYTQTLCIPYTWLASNWIFLCVNCQMNTASQIWGIQWNRSKDSCRIHSHNSNKQKLIWHTHINTSQTHTHTCQTHTQLSNTASILSSRVRWCGGHDKVLSVLLELTSRSYSRFFLSFPHFLPF